MHYSTPAAAPSSKPAPWFHLFLAALAVTAWSTLSLRDTEARLNRASELLARTESRLEKSRTEVRDLKKSVDEVKTMVGILVEDIDASEGDEGDEYADEVDDGPYLASKGGNSRSATSPITAL